MALQNKPIAVLGAGAVGSILAANFAAAGEKVILIESAPHRFEQIQSRGLEVSPRTPTPDRPPISVRPAVLLRSMEELKGYEPEALFICTKTWSLRGILPELAQVLSPETLVVSFQNGIGLEDEVAELFPQERVARGIVNYAGKVNPESGKVTQAWFNPPNYLGPLVDGTGPRIERLASVLSRSPLVTHAIPPQDTKKRVFFKTILNSALNALCATTGITMRQAMSYTHTRNLARMLIREGLSVASAVGYNFGENGKAICMKYLDEGGDHLPSMWDDLQRGVPTEIEHINGKIVKIGLMFKNVDVDANVFFTSMVITHEVKSGVRKPEDIPEYLQHF
jgi:2-dehydropantoate 2-reductase